MMEQTTTWLCPICEKVLEPEELVLDGYVDRSTFFRVHANRHVGTLAIYWPRHRTLWKMWSLKPMANGTQTITNTVPPTGWLLIPPSLSQLKPPRFDQSPGQMTAKVQTRAPSLSPPMTRTMKAGSNVNYLPPTIPGHRTTLSIAHRAQGHRPLVLS